MTSEPAPPQPTPFSAISLRGRIAFGVACLEELAQHFELRGPRFDDLIERLWRPVVAPAGDARTTTVPRNVSDISELFANAPTDDPLESIRLALNAFSNVLVCATDPAAVTRARTEGFLAELVAVLERAGATPPVAAFFAERSPINTNGYGELGRAAPPVYFREGLSWDDLEPALRRGLCAISVQRRREAAFAASHLGLPSQALERVLRRAVRDPDPEVRTHSLAAWHRLFAGSGEIAPGVYTVMPAIPDFRALLQERDAKWSPPMSGSEAILAALDDQHSPDARRRAIERCRPFLAISERVCDRVTEALQDLWPEVRLSAAVWLSEAPFTEQRLAALMRVASERSTQTTPVIRAAALFSIGSYGPRASAAVPMILEQLDGVSEPHYDPVAFYGAEALEAIGSAAFRLIVNTITSGRRERAERWLRSLALRPDLADLLVEEITRQATPDEAWLMARVQRAVAILRSNEP